jgi:IclR family pca regulon transcriptional regulator
MIQSPIPAAADSPLFNHSLAKAFAILEAFGIERRAMNLPEIAAAAGISKSAAQRLTFSLEALNYLRKDPVTKKYQLAAHCVELGMRYTTTSTLIESASPYLLDLNIRCGETVNLSEPDAEDMVFVTSLPGHKEIFVQLPIGGRYPMYCTAAGRAYLSGLPKAEADAYLRGAEIHAYTPATLTKADEIIALVDAARERGFAYAHGEFFRGDVNVAAPVFGSHGRAVAAVGVSVPVTRWSMEQALAEIAPQVSEVAQTLSSLNAPKRPVVATSRQPGR